MTYKFARFENDSINKYQFHSYKEALFWVESEIVKFKEVNKVRDESKDKSFIRYRDSLHEELEKQKAKKGQSMNDYTECRKCDPSEHEGVFCRCESRNIRIAKEQRVRGESDWQTEKLKHEDH